MKSILFVLRCTARTNGTALIYKLRFGWQEPPRMEPCLESVS